MGIGMVPEQFDQDRGQDPKRAAGDRVFDALQNLDPGGHCLYEFSYRRGGVQVDCALCLDGLGRFSVRVNGGQQMVCVDGLEPSTGFQQGAIENRTGAGAGRIQSAGRAVAHFEVGLSSIIEC